MRVVVEKSQSGKTFGIAIMGENDKPFSVIKNCRLAKRQDGTEFVSPPSVKMEDGKWLNHAYISAELQDQVLASLAAMDACAQAPTADDFDDSDLPF